MRILIVIFLSLSFGAYGQSGVDVYIMECATLNSKEAKKECTDEIILGEIGTKWDSLSSKVKDGVYFVEYTIYSDGKAEAKKIKRVPSVVDPSNEMEVLKGFVNQAINKHDWQLPIKVNGIITGSSQYLKINTSRF